MHYSTNNMTIEVMNVFLFLLMYVTYFCEDLNLCAWDL